MRIGVVCYPTYGGSGVVASELALAMAQRGHDVHVISYACPPRIDASSSLVHFHQVEVRHYPLFQYPPYSLALATKMVEIARKHALDLVHVHYAVPNAVSAILARQILAPQRLAVVTTLHGTDITLVGNDPSYLETTRFSVLSSDVVTAVSQDLRRRTLEQLDIDREIEVIPNFIDPARTKRPETVERKLSEPGEKVLVHVSNFRRVKRLNDVIEIFRRVHDRLPSRLLLVGDGPERESTQQQLGELGLEAASRWLGTIDDVEEVLWESDLFLLPSAEESFGLAALEALACEVPVIASRAGGIPEVVRDGDNGRLFEIGDVEGMAAAAIELLTDDPLHRQYAAAGRQWAIGAFSQEHVVERYRELYRRVASPAEVV